MCLRLDFETLWCAVWMLNRLDFVVIYSLLTGMMIVD